MTLNEKHDTQHNRTEFVFCFIVMLSVVMLNAVKVSAVMLNVVKLSAVMLNSIMLSVSFVLLLC
jgi:hypothetical protein